MNNRWLILAVLFFARMTMAFQFQAVGALSPLIVEEYSIGLADIGLLVGLYLAPGALIAIPGGALAVRFGDKRLVSFGLVLMLAGGLFSIVSEDWNFMVAGRVLAGTGGVILNVVMTKMLVDWFAGREISTAMAIFVNSWPVGIAAALFILPVIAAAGGLSLAGWFVVILIALGLVLFALFYGSPAGADSIAPSIRPAAFPVYALLLASLIWALYNAALAMVFSFGPLVLSKAGWSLESAGSAISAFMFVLALALPIGGVLADRTGKRSTIIFASLFSFSVLMPVVPLAPPSTLIVILLMVGGIFAFAAGPIMTLPSMVLPEQSRAFGMGVFYTVYYVVMMVSPRIAGGLADRIGDPAVAFHAGAAMCVIGIIALALFHRTSAARTD